MQLRICHLTRNKPECDATNSQSTRNQAFDLREKYAVVYAHRKITKDASPFKTDRRVHEKKFDFAVSREFFRHLKMQLRNRSLVYMVI
jgi:hypothetical protein